MFERNLGIHITETSDKKWIIGKVLLDEFTGNIKILNPLGIKHTSVKSNDTMEMFKLSMYTLSEMSDGKYIILIADQILSMFPPKKDLMTEYLRIKKSIDEMQSEYESINMNNIFNSLDDSKDNIKNVLKGIFDTLDNVIQEKSVDAPKENKKSWKRKRWLDNM